MPRLLSVFARLSHHFLSFQLHTVANPIELASNFACFCELRLETSESTERRKKTDHGLQAKSNQIQQRRAKQQNKRKHMLQPLGSGVTENR